MSRVQSKATVISLAARLPTPDTVRLTMALQTTLELEEMLAIFAREVTGFVPYDGIVWRAPAGVEMKIGAPGTHRCAYQLTLLDQDLGEIEFSRNRRFGETELATLETLLSATVYPLRNALTYREALRAAFKDPLTGIGNRRAFEETIPREIHVARRQTQGLALLAIDLDHFKRVNDRHGHQTGDCMLRAAARRIQGAIRTSDQVFRYGGEEFAVLLTNTTEAGALMVAERIRKAVADEMMLCAEETLQITVSIGVALLSGADEAASLFAKADSALYQAKAAGRNRIEIHHSAMH